MTRSNRRQQRNMNQEDDGQPANQRRRPNPDSDLEEPQPDPVPQPNPAPQPDPAPQPNPVPQPNPAPQPAPAALPDYRLRTFERMTIPSTYTKVSIADLRSMEHGSNKIYLDAQLIRIVSATSNNDTNGSMSNYSYYQRGKRNQRSSAQYTRMFLLREYETSDVFYIIEDRNNNKNIWLRGNHRDNGNVTIGTYVTIINPQPIRNIIGNDTPIVNTGIPAVIRLFPRNLREVPILDIIDANITKSFALSGANLDIHYIAVKQACSGLFCDRQKLDTAQQKCGCYTMISRLSNIVLQFEVSVSSDVGRFQFTTNNFSSYQFSCLFLSDGRLPPSVQANTFQQNFTMLDQICGSVEDCVQFINNNGGFDVVGWYKQGEINDQGNADDQANVEANTTQYHLVYAVPTRRNLNYDHLKYTYVAV